MQFDIHLVFFAPGHLALEIDPYSNLDRKSYLTFFPLSFESLETLMNLTTAMQIKYIGCWLPHICIFSSEQ